MASNFTINVKGLDKVQAIFRDLPKQVQSEIGDEMQAVGDEWVGAARTDAPANNSRLRGSISDLFSVLSTSGGNLIALEITAQTEYAGYQEFGTKGNVMVPGELQGYAAGLQGPGNGGVNPIEALTLWVKRKGLNAVTYNVKTRKKSFKNKEAAARSIAFLIFRKIKREGLKPKSFLFSSRNSPGTGDRMEFFIKKLKTNIAAVLQRAL